MTTTDATPQSLGTERAPTLFEWAGGPPAPIRMTRVFDGTYVPQDLLLRPHFAQMAPDHPGRVAAWLGEVFDGPAGDTERYGRSSPDLPAAPHRRAGREIRVRFAGLLTPPPHRRTATPRTRAAGCGAGG
jgi:hypothetical protein